LDLVNNQNRDASFGLTPTICANALIVALVDVVVVSKNITIVERILNVGFIPPTSTSARIDALAIGLMNFVTISINGADVSARLGITSISCVRGDGDRT
jgi:hypothetical protein